MKHDVPETFVDKLGGDEIECPKCGKRFLCTKGSWGYYLHKRPSRKTPLSYELHGNDKMYYCGYTCWRKAQREAIEADKKEGIKLW